MTGRPTTHLVTRQIASATCRRCASSKEQVAAVGTCTAGFSVFENLVLASSGEFRERAPCLVRVCPSVTSVRCVPCLVEHVRGPGSGLLLLRASSPGYGHPLRPLSVPHSAPYLP